MPSGGPAHRLPTISCFFGYPGRSEQTSWEKSHEALRLIGLTSNTESSLFFTSPSVPSHRKNQPSIVKRSILDFRQTTHYHAYPHLAVKTRPKELESVRWSILAATGHPKCAAALVKILLHMVGIITDDASIANDNTQVGEMQHDVEIVKELVRRQTHKGRELRRFGPYEHPRFLPRSSLDPGWWHWRRVFWNAMERRYGAHQCSGTPCPSGSSPMEVASAGKLAFQRLAHFIFICCFGSSI